MLHKHEPFKILLNGNYSKCEIHTKRAIFRSIEFYIYVDNFKKQKEHKKMYICL